jgi:hypothetical protein
VLSALEEVHDEFMDGKGRGIVEDVMIYGGSRYWVISTNLWGLNVCEWEGRGLMGVTRLIIGAVKTMGPFPYPSTCGPPNHMPWRTHKRTLYKFVSRFHNGIQ